LLREAVNHARSLRATTFWVRLLVWSPPSARREVFLLPYTWLGLAAIGHSDGSILF